MKNKTYIVDLDEDKSISLVQEYLKDLGYSEKVDIKRFISKSTLRYEICNYIDYHGEETMVLSEITCGDYMEILKKIFERENNVVLQICPVIKKERVSFNIAYSYKLEKTYRK